MIPETITANIEAENPPLSFKDKEVEVKVKPFLPLAEKINALEKKFSNFTDEELKAKTDEFKNRLRMIPLSKEKFKDLSLDQARSLFEDPDNISTPPNWVFKSIAPEGKEGRASLTARPSEGVFIINVIGGGARRIESQKLFNELVEHNRESLSPDKEIDSLDDLLPEAFATIRETTKRVLGLRHHDIQIIGGISLHQGNVVEMKTGEGKTITSLLPAYLNALAGEGVHIVTSNDYLAGRDAKKMGEVFDFLGLSVGVISSEDKNKKSKRKAYAANITYGPAAEFGFDYLRDNLEKKEDQKVQRGHAFAIADEVDDTLIDEGTTPLIATKPEPKLKTEGEQEKRGGYKNKLKAIAKAVEKLSLEMVEVSEETHQVLIRKKEEFYKNLEETDETITAVEQALKAKFIYTKNVDYIVNAENKIIIINSSTGRKMLGRTWSDGIHQALQAKEGLEIEDFKQDLGSIGIQAYFQMYKKLAGMTGTAEVYGEEFYHAYGMETTYLPPNTMFEAAKADSTLVKMEEEDDSGNKITYYYEKSDQEKKPVFWERTSYQDEIYLTEEAKTQAILKEIEAMHAQGRPLLVGTDSVLKSEGLAKQIAEKLGFSPEEGESKIQVLHAKNHEQEAEIISRAGKFKGITIATNMAGRGVDIKLGGELDDSSVKTVNQFLEENGVENPHDLTNQEKVDYLKELLKKMRESKRSGGVKIKKDKRDKIKKFIEQVTNEHEVKERGGLHVIFASGVRKSVRIKTQMTGRSARQGDPGSSRSYASLEDQLFKAGAGRRIEAKLEELKKILIEDDVDLSLPFDLNKSKNLVPELHEYIWDLVNDVQEKIEKDGVETRLHMMKYDRVNNKQREAYYRFRESLINFNDFKIPPDMTKFLVLEAISQLWSNHLSNLSALRTTAGLPAYGQQDPLATYQEEASQLFYKFGNKAKAIVLSHQETSQTNF